MLQYREGGRFIALLEVSELWFRTYVTTMKREGEDMILSAQQDPAVAFPHDLIPGS
jgi:hypothetical protein